MIGQYNSLMRCQNQPIKIRGIYKSIIQHLNYFNPLDQQCPRFPLNIYTYITIIIEYFIFVFN